MYLSKRFCLEHSPVLCVSEQETSAFISLELSLYVFFHHSSHTPSRIFPAVYGIKANHIESVLTNQLLRAGTSVGANIHEAQFAQGSRDFVAKLETSLKECNECKYWLNLLKETGSIAESDCKDLMNQCTELRRILVSSINTRKSKA